MSRCTNWQARALCRRQIDALAVSSGRTTMKATNKMQKFRLLIFEKQPYMFRVTNSPIVRRTFWLYIQLLVQCTDTAADRCIVQKAVYTVKKFFWGWANLSPGTCRADLKRLINERVFASCWLLTSLYWWCTGRTLQGCAFLQLVDLNGRNGIKWPNKCKLL